MIPIIDPEDDYLTIAAAEEQMAITHEARQKDMHDTAAKVKRECSRPPARPTACPPS